ncbi:hypothetical protein KHA94_08630 [Bacillus sp. FJAT-49705]|uniref:Flagellar protein FliT n=1 Tax=Cytobacillus citreus TaxID=2833586 RepID=A0ABS5NR22_9BACI|nr:hypothetical protein [Cytobacillus citreus]MBS4190267.1 hypothetical protein [Cytobacillus citreus]
MDCIEQLYAITNQLKSSVSKEKHRDRDQQIEELTKYLETRGTILASIDPNLLTSDDKSKLKEIQDISEDIINQMEKIKTSIQHDIIQAKKGMSAFKGYNNDPYSASSFDGHYFDRKK